MLSSNKKRGFTPTPNLASRLSAKPQLMPKLVSGFTFLETIVAVGILTIALASPLTLASSSIRAAGTAKDKFIASYLAGEAVEFVKNVRDYNAINKKSDWLETILGQCGENKVCRVDVTEQGLGNALKTCKKDEECVLKYDSLSGFYNHDSENNTNKITKFTRKVVVSKSLIQPDAEAKITVTVSWGGPGSPFIIQDNIFNWR